MKRKTEIKKTVLEVLTNDKKSRNSDRYLYVSVVKLLNPELAYKPFAEAMLNANIPCFETVRRTRQHFQEWHPELRADANVEAARKLEEEEYKETVVDWGMKERFMKIINSTIKKNKPLITGVVKVEEVEHGTNVNI